MARWTVPRRIEALFQRLVERPFLRRIPISLPLLKGSLRRAMQDELKAVVPSRYTITVPAEQIETLDSSRSEWETELADHFLQVLRDNGWSAVGRPRITIAYDPDLHDDEVRVAVEEPDLIHNGGVLRRPRRGGQIAAALLFAAVLLLCGFALVALLRPELLEGSQVARPRPADPQQPLVLPWSDLQRRANSWWESSRDAILGAAPGESQGEVIATPCLTVRAATPSTRGATRPESCIPKGAVLRWRAGQVVKGEAFGGEDRWLEVGEAGPEWGNRAGQKLYVWMGGVRER